LRQGVGNSALASMSKRQYPWRDVAATTAQEDTPMSLKYRPVLRLSKPYAVSSVGYRSRRYVR
jgi:hypothetical protein